MKTQFLLAKMEYFYFFIGGYAVFFTFCVAYILLVQKDCVFCFAKKKDAEHFPLENVRFAKMYLMQKCI